MPRKVSRSFGILDAMILMIGVAFGALLTRLYLVNNYEVFFDRLQDVPSNQVYVRWILSESADFACLWLTAITPAVFLIRVRRPKPSLSRLLRQPGATALFTVAVLALFCGIMAGIAIAIEGSGPWFYYYQVYLLRLFPYVGASVAAVWLIQVLGRRFRPEPGGIDRLGRFLGICWITSFLIGSMVSLLEGADFARTMPNPTHEEILARKEEDRLSTLEDARERQARAEENAAMFAKFEKSYADHRKSLDAALETAKNERSRIGKMLEKGDAGEMKEELSRIITSHNQEEINLIQKIKEFDQFLEQQKAVSPPN